MAAKMKVKGLTFLFFRSHVLIWLFSSKLGEIWKSLGGIWAKMVLEVPFAPVKCSRLFLDVIFFGCFWASLRKLGKISSHS